MQDARTVLDDPALAQRLTRLGLRHDDLTDALGGAVAVRSSPAALAEVNRLADALRQTVGRFPGEPDHDAFPGYDGDSDPHGVGVQALWALVVTAPDLVAFHRSRGIPDDVSAATLGELGQQLHVHRLTFGRFGLHTYGWLAHTWSGSLYWLGRLQFNLELLAEGRVCSTHIPRSGPLDPASVDASFARAAAFFPTHFPDRSVTDFWCRSWLLDPALAAALDPASNMARFQARWRLYGEPMPGDDDALFFCFARRGAVDPVTLPRETSLQRAILDRWAAGDHWAVRDGRLPLVEVAR
ncbi:acyltransferase domain-containing protein [Microlunatus lacustris]